MPQCVLGSLVGMRFGRLVVIGESGRCQGGRLMLGRCDCCAEMATRLSSLKNGHSRSCGCLRRDSVRSAPRHLIHGLSDTPIYNTWRSMMRRCYKADYKKYPERWHSFALFVDDMAPRPEGKTLDRKD